MPEHSRPARVLVTGASGFLGTVLSLRLLEAGYEVVAMGHTGPVAWPGLEAAEKAWCAIEDEDALTRHLRGVDAVCHLAGASGVRASGDAAAVLRGTNEGGTQAVLRALRRTAGTRRGPAVLVHCSSASTYGIGAGLRRAFSELDSLAPASAYGRSKLWAERALELAAESGYVVGVSLRVFNAAGAGAGRGDARLDRLIPRVLATAAGRAPALTVFGDGRAVRDYVHVDDVATAFLAALAVPSGRPHRAYNVGAVEASVRDVVEAAERITGRAVETDFADGDAGPARLVADTRRIRRELRWQPATTTLDTIVGDAWAALGEVAAPPTPVRVTSPSA